MGSSDPPRILFVTGRLAEFALRQVLEELAPRAGFAAVVAVLPISVAALMPPQWVARHLVVPPGIDRVILPGHCRGDLGPVIEKAGGVAVERGPEDLRDLPRYFGHEEDRRAGYGEYDIAILAEINHAPRLDRGALLAMADRFAAEGADLIDLGCDPGGPWLGVGEAVAALRDRGLRVSIDSFDPTEVGQAVAAGAELVLSVDATNRERAADWGVEVVALPDRAGALDGLDATVEFLDRKNVPFRIDPIVEPIGFGFAASLGRYLEVRRRYPETAMMMGVGNLTELTDGDSAGINTLLIGFCQEVRVGSVLTTAVINWARSSVREIDLARRLVYHAVIRRTLPKHLEPRLVLLRDPKVARFGAENLEELARRIKDPNWRLFAEDGRLYAINHDHFLVDTDPFVLFDRMGVTEASHAFYLGYELMKAKTALTLNKTYRQDQALDWGFLTDPEISHRDRIREADPTAGNAGNAEGNAAMVEAPRARCSDGEPVGIAEESVQRRHLLPKRQGSPREGSHELVRRRFQERAERAGSTTVSKPFDATTRYLLEAHPDAWPGYLGLPAAGPVGAINADLSTVTSEADKVLRVDGPEPWLLHVELQSGADRTLPRRLLRYNVLLDLRHDLPVQSVAVILRPEADRADLTGTYRRQLPGGDVHHEFRYRVVRTWQQPVEQVLEGGLGTLPLAPLADVTEAALPDVLRRMGERLERETVPQDAATLWTATYVLMGLRYPKDVAAQLLQGVRAMKESVTYQAILEEGEAKGIAKGRTQEAKQTLLRMGQKRFGPPGAAVVAAIEAIPDHERAAALTDRVLDVSSWEELLAPEAGD